MHHAPWVLASDIDNTLTGNPQALTRLAERIGWLRRQGKLYLFLSTGRTLQEVLDGFEQEHLPAADGLITQVGTEIYLPPFSPDMEPLAEWDRRLRRQFSREQAEAFVKDIAGAERQPDHYNTPLKVSYFLEKAPHPTEAAALVRRRAAQAGGNYRVVWSSSCHLDILPAAAGKGKAIRFLLNFLQLAPRQVIVAGDSGNDRSMFDEFGRGIVVANAQPELKKLKVENPQGEFYFAKHAFAAGVEEGLRHFGLL